MLRDQVFIDKGFVRSGQGETRSNRKSDTMMTCYPRIWSFRPLSGIVLGKMAL